MKGKLSRTAPNNIDTFMKRRSAIFSEKMRKNYHPHAEDPWPGFAIFDALSPIEAVLGGVPIACYIAEDYGYAALTSCIALTLIVERWLDDYRFARSSESQLRRDPAVEGRERKHYM